MLAEGFPRDDPRREAARYTKEGGSCAEFIGSLPSQHCILGNADVSITWAQYLGEPIPILKDHIGLGLPHQSAANRNLKIDRHGISLASCRALKGGYATARHDTFLDTIVS